MTTRACSPGASRRYADAYELAGTERALLVCLDQVTDPHNLGAVIRSAEGAGATGVVVPAHGAARVTPAVCRASAAPSSTLSSPWCRTSPAIWNDAGPNLWVWERAADGDAGCGRSARAVPRSSSGQREGLRPLVRRACDEIVSIPLGPGDPLNVSVAAALLIYEARRRRGA